MSKKREVVTADGKPVDAVFKVYSPNFLDEDFEMSENRETGLSRAVNLFSEKTIYLTVDPTRLKLYSLYKMPADEDEELQVIKINPNFADVRLFMPQNMNQMYFHKRNKTAGNIRIQSLKKQGMTDSQIDDIKAAGFFMQYETDDGKSLTLIPSRAFMATLCNQIKIGKLNTGVDPIRDIYIASKLCMAEKFVLVYRKYHAYGKAFGCFSPNYVHNPQSIIMEFRKQLSEFGSVTVRHWSINHFVTKVDFAFNNISVRLNGKKTKVTPGVRLLLSDVGDSAYILQNTFYLNGGVVTFDDLVTKRHRGALDIDSLVESYRSEVFPNLKRAIEKLEHMDDFEIRDVREGVVKLLWKIGFNGQIGRENAADFKEKHLPKSEPGTSMDAVLYVLKVPGIIRNSNYKGYVLDNASACVSKILKLDVGATLKCLR